MPSWPRCNKAVAPRDTMLGMCAVQFPASTTVDRCPVNGAVSCAGAMSRTTKTTKITTA
jgi:hypothetical protein